MILIMISKIPTISAVIYYVICYSHGDFSAAAMAQEDWGPCISEADGFVSVFLFSMETQHTIGYGTRQTTTNCPHAIVLMSLQVHSQTYSYIYPRYLYRSYSVDGAYLGGDWLHHPGLHGRTRVLEIIETQKQKQDDHLQ